MTINEDSKYTPDNITSLGEDEVFVFGSNLAGHHAGGAARTSLHKFGAVWGQGVGLQGQSYAIPTMQGGVETIKPYVDEFIAFVKKHPKLTFYVTCIGCGIADFKDEEIAPLFSEAVGIENVILPKTFFNVLAAEQSEANNLNRFLEGQRTPFADYELALNEVNNGRKIFHWIWYIFPQLCGLGHSRQSTYYGIAD